ncbi:MAG: hypothetical protein LIP09_04905 [Bacteroidales bacterium]|nr:hypothetical protein [Bacteroidales bacterium]
MEIGVRDLRTIKRFEERIFTVRDEAEHLAYRQLVRYCNNTYPRPDGFRLHTKINKESDPWKISVKCEPKP